MSLVVKAQGTVGNTGLSVSDLPFPRGNVLARALAKSVTSVDASDTLDPSNTFEAISSFEDFPSGAPSYSLRGTNHVLLKEQNGIAIADAVESPPASPSGYDLPDGLLDGLGKVTILAVFKPALVSTNSILTGALSGSSSSPMMSLGLNSSNQLQLSARHSLISESALIAASSVVENEWMGCIATVDYAGPSAGVSGGIELETLTPLASSSGEVIKQPGFGANIGNNSSMPSNTGVGLLARNSATTAGGQVFQGQMERVEFYSGDFSDAELERMRNFIRSRVELLGAT